MNCFGLVLTHDLLESPYRYRDSDAQDLSGQICKMGDWADAHGGYADIWRAQWKRDVGISLHVSLLSYASSCY